MGQVSNRYKSSTYSSWLIRIRSIECLSKDHSMPLDPIWLSTFNGHFFFSIGQLRPPFLYLIGLVSTTNSASSYLKGRSWCLSTEALRIKILVSFHLILTMVSTVKIPPHDSTAMQAPVLNADVDQFAMWSKQIYQEKGKQRKCRNFINMVRTNPEMHLVWWPNCGVPWEVKTMIGVLLITVFGCI